MEQFEKLEENVILFEVNIMYCNHYEDNLPITSCNRHWTIIK